MSSTVAASTRPVVSCDPLSDLILGSLADKRGTGRFREDLLQLAWRKVRAAFPRSPSDEYDVGHGAFGWDGLTRFDSLSEEAFELPQGAGHGRTLVANRPHVATA